MERDHVCKASCRGSTVPCKGCQPLVMDGICCGGGSSSSSGTAAMTHGLGSQQGRGMCMVTTSFWRSLIPVMSSNLMNWSVEVTPCLVRTFCHTSLMLHSISLVRNWAFFPAVSSWVQPGVLGTPGLTMVSCSDKERDFAYSALSQQNSEQSFILCQGNWHLKWPGWFVRWTLAN